MKSISSFATAALVFAFLLGGATAALAATKTVPKMGQDELKARCEAGGGLYFPPGAGGVYACLTKSGDLVSCGGTSDDCSINRTQPRVGTMLGVQTLTVAPQ